MSHLRSSRAAAYRVCAFAVLLAGSSIAGAQVTYSISQIAPLRGDPFMDDLRFVTGMNSAGVVVGYVIPQAGTVTYAFRGSTNLGGPLDSFARGVNASGQVTGSTRDPLNLGRSLAFRTTASGGIVTGPGGSLLGTLGGTGGSSGAGINASGQVTGSASTPTGMHAFRTTPTGLISDPGTDLGAFSGGTNSAGTAINELGQVTGYSDFGAGLVRAFRTTPTGLASDPGADLGTLGGAQSRGLAINTSGQVAGWALNSAAEQHAFRSTANGAPVGLTDLGTLGGTTSTANSINSLGIVVGDSTFAPGNTTTRAFVYDSVMRDLNTLIPSNSGWTLTNAISITDNGLILAIGTRTGFPASYTFAARLTPVPEPGTVLLVGAVAGTWLWRRRAGGRPERFRPSLQSVSTVDSRQIALPSILQ